MELKYFKMDEVRCPCCHEIGPFFDMELMHCADVIREHVGKSLKVNSGFRCPSHNLEIGGSPKSKHMEGAALDISTINLNKEEIYEFINRAMILNLRIGVYERHIHIDIAEPAIFWRG